MPSFIPTCPSGEFTVGAGNAYCDVAWEWVEYSPMPWWYLPVDGAAEVLGAVALVFALAWGLRLLVRGVLKQP